MTLTLTCIVHHQVRAVLLARSDAVAAACVRLCGEAILGG
jgi:hypothetical protein